MYSIVSIEDRRGNAAGNVKEGLSKKELEKATQGHILAQTELVGLYKKE